MLNSPQKLTLKEGFTSFYNWVPAKLCAMKQASSVDWVNLMVDWVEALCQAMTYWWVWEHPKIGWGDPIQSPQIK